MGTREVQPPPPPPCYCSRKQRFMGTREVQPPPPPLLATVPANKGSWAREKYNPPSPPCYCSRKQRFMGTREVQPPLPSLLLFPQTKVHGHTRSTTPLPPPLSVGCKIRLCQKFMCSMSSFTNIRASASFYP